MAVRKPDIVNDELSTYILELQKEYKPKNILDIGAGAGDGATSYMDRRRCFALEMDKENYDALNSRYEKNKKVTAVYSPSTSFVVDADWVWDMYHEHPNWIIWKVIGIDEVLKWRDNTEKKIKSFKDADGIRAIKKKYKLETFGMVLIDGSPFTAEQELNEVWGSKIIILDDVRDIKNWQNYEKLKDSDYKLLRYNPLYRNGYAVFVRE